MLPRRARPLAPRRRAYVAFVAAGRRWVLPAEQIAAVGALGAVTRLPTADACRLGLTLHRGRVVALVAPAAFNGAGPASGRGRHLVVLRAGGGCVGFAAEELLGLRVEYGDAVPEGFAVLEIAP